MNSTAIIVSFAMLALAAVIYWSAGGKRDARINAQRLQKDIQEIKSKQMEFADEAANSNEEEYNRGRRHLAAAREQLGRLDGDSMPDRVDQSRLALADIEELDAQLEENYLAGRTATVSQARQARDRLAQRVSRLKARVLLLVAESKANAARTAALEQRLPQAEELLDEAMELMRRGSQDLVAEPDYDVLTDNLRRAVREVSVCLRTHAQWTAGKMDRMLAESNRLVRRLETDGRKAPAGPSSSRPDRLAEPAVRA
jgi:hypothetical protein